jgi:hypothetical protein
MSLVLLGIVCLHVLLSRTYACRPVITTRDAYGSTSDFERVQVPDLKQDLIVDRFV